MKVSLITFLLLACFSFVGPTPVPHRIWITDVTIVSPENLDSLDRGSVLIENGHIARVDRKANAKPPAGAMVVSGEGGFLIPGLIDSHVHLASVPGVTPELNLSPDAAHVPMIADYYRQLPRSYLYFGYTTLIDLAIVKQEILDGFRRAPLHPDQIADIRSCADLLNLVEYSTHLEGMAVLAAYQRRQKDHALGGDPDYIALDDQARMQADLASYFRDYDYLKSRGSQVADADAWEVIKRMSSGERLWYRVGAYMAQRIEASKGRVVLVDLVKEGPTKFITTYESLVSAQT